MLNSSYNTDRRDYARYKDLCLQADTYVCLLQNFDAPILTIDNMVFHVAELLDTPFISVNNDLKREFFVDIEFRDEYKGYVHIRKVTNHIEVHPA